MKVAVVGNGNVGKAVFRELQYLREINELVIVGRNAKSCRAEVEDYMDALPMRIDELTHIDGGGYELAKDADILIYCSGPSVKVEDRLSIAAENIRVMQEIFSQVDKYAPNAIVIAITNLLDVVTTAIQKCTKRPPEKVIGTGTLLDTARLKKLVSQALDVSFGDIEGYVVGEHGASSVVLNSAIRVMGMGIEDYIDLNCSGVIPNPGDELETDVRDAGFKIFRGKGYTSAGVAAAATRIIYNIINDTHEICPVSTVLNGQYGVNGFALSVPCMIGKGGIVSVKNVKMNEQEMEKFRHSADIVKNACISAGLEL